MRKYLGVFIVVLLLSACGQNDSDLKGKQGSEVSQTNQTSEKKDKNEKVTSEKPTTEKPTTEKPTTEKPTSEEVNSLSPSKEKSHDFGFIDDKGYINILDKNFIDYYFSSNRQNEIGPVKVGMSKSEVESLFGPSRGPGNNQQYYMSARYGDIAVDYDNSNHVSKVVINTSTAISTNDIKSVYGEPTVDMNQYYKENDEPVASPSIDFVYDSNNSNGYAVIVTFDKIDGNVRLISTVGEDISKRYKASMNKSVSSVSEANGSEESNAPQSDLEYLAEVKKDIDNLEADPSNENLKYMLWNKLIRGVSGEKFKDNPKLKAEALDVFNRYSRINPDAERYRNMYDY
ncbi:hypothetical protein [Macrococcoides canis]|uniref:hypothetical protein n=1 Tax=Macrococcoides canis TaxID=1855823 RepID=UPI0010FC0A8F|nr:hypothetical protein [Macrococcus canis]QCT74186.1 hypothetical protein EST43_02590 [Macrococcus canis]